MKIVYREERTDELPELESASLRIVGVACPTGLTAVLVEAASAKLRVEAGESPELKLTWDDGQPALLWSLHEDESYLMPHELFEGIVARDYDAAELAAARSVVVRDRPDLAVALPADGPALRAAVADLQWAIASGPPAGFRIEGVADHYSCGEVWVADGIVPEVTAGAEAAAFGQAVVRFRQLADAVGADPARRICAVQAEAMAALPADAVWLQAGPATELEFSPQVEALERRCWDALRASGALDGLSGSQRGLAQALVRTRVPAFMVTEVGRSVAV